MSVVKLMETLENRYLEAEDEDFRLACVHRASNRIAHSSGSILHFKYVSRLKVLNLSSRGTIILNLDDFLLEIFFNVLTTHFHTCKHYLF